MCCLLGTDGARPVPEKRSDDNNKNAASGKVSMIIVLAETTTRTGKILETNGT
jgi:hypothetical protein